jgi:hypothetical protein
MMTPEELETLATGETLFASPIPVQSVSSDEFMPPPQTRASASSRRASRNWARASQGKQGVTRRRFFKSAGGMAAAFVAMNEVYARGSAPLYEVLRNEEKNPELAQAQRRWPEGRVRHGHAHPFPARRHAPGRLRAPARGGGQGGLEPGARRQGRRPSTT